MQQSGPQEDQLILDKEMEDFCAQLKEKEQEELSANEQEIAKLKEEIQDIREARVKMRSIVSSVSSGITIYPPGSSSSEDNRMEEGEEDKQLLELPSEGIEGGEREEQLQGLEGRESQLEVTSAHQEDKDIETHIKLQESSELDSVLS